jgi:CRISPR/Cas system CSM-associated protein Csm3 (group 7 of RAMP superfamily)
VTIDRITRTASDERLFHEEFVPPSVSFEVKISGQDFSDAEITDLLWLLNSFNSGIAKLGAGSGSGYGLMRWELTDLQRMTKDDVAKWIANGAPSTGYAALQSLPQAEREAYATKAVQVRTPITQPESLTLNVRLNFQSNFLVNDPSRTGTLEEKKAGHTPLLNVAGKPLLPATSIRGAFRSQAEKIVRTIGNEKCACYLNDRGERASCLAVESTDAISDLCPICQIFGAAGWKAAVDFSDFLAVDSIREENLFQQEFVAIDRFTGGGAEAKKFNTRSMDRPILRGTITLDLLRLKRIADNGWPLGLLTLVLRDLIEGDVRFGLGSAKGYGTARLTIEGLRLPDWDACPTLFKTGFAADQWGLLSAANPPDEPIQKILMQWVTDLQARIQHEGANQ